MGPTNYTWQRAACNGDERPVHLDWTHDDNAAYQAKTETVGRAIEAANPDHMDMSKATSCKQKPGEPVKDYYNRLPKCSTKTAASQSQLTEDTPQDHGMYT